MEPRSRWAYRAHANDPLVEVEVIRPGARKPARVLVQFVGDEFEGRREWVPPARLKAPWHQATSYLDREARWARVAAVATVRDTPEYIAAATVFDLLIDVGEAELCTNRYAGVVKIHKASALAARLHLEPGLLTGHEASFVEEGSVIAPWPAARRIAVSAARSHPEQVRESVERDANQAAYLSAYGVVQGQTLPPREADAAAGVWASIDEQVGQPVRRLLTDWCGTGAREQWAQVDLLRDEVRRLEALLDSAITLLEEAGSARAARLIARAKTAPAPLRGGCGSTVADV